MAAPCKLKLGWVLGGSGCQGGTFRFRRQTIGAGFRAREGGG
jgi:hypothetical protein